MEERVHLVCITKISSMCQDCISQDLIAGKDKDNELDPACVLELRDNLGVLKSINPVNPGSSHK